MGTCYIFMIVTKTKKASETYDDKLFCQLKKENQANE